MCYKHPGDSNKKASTVSHSPQAAVVSASCLSITLQLPIQKKKTAVMFFCVKPMWLKFIETTFNNIYLFIDSCGSPSIHGNLGQMQQQRVVIHQVKILVRTTYVFRLFPCICDLFSVLSIWQTVYTGCTLATVFSHLCDVSLVDADIFYALGLSEQLDGPLQE